MHVLVDGHDTADSPGLPPGLGVDWIAQVLPFQCAANVTEPPVRRESLPTAVQSSDAGHDTPNSKLPPLSTGFGVSCTPQVPAQRSMSVASSVLLPEA